MATSVFGTQCVQTDNILCKATTWIWRVAPVICIAVGTLGNSVNIVVLSRENLRSKPCFILMFVGIADLLYLWSIPFGDLLRFGYGILLEEVSRPLCMANISLGFIFSGVSLWMLAVFSTGRMLFVVLPHQSNIHLNRKASIWAFVGVSVCVSILCLVPLTMQMREASRGVTANQTTEMDRENSTSCFPVSYNEDSIEGVFDLLAVALVIFVPILIILFGNCVLVLKLCRRPNQSDADNAQINLLFAVSGLVLASLMPYGIFYYIMPVIDEQADIKAPIYGLIHAIVENLATCNHALNFFIYFWKSSLFKAEFNKVVEEIKSRICRSRPE